MERGPSPKNQAVGSSTLRSLTASESAEVLAALLVAHPELAGEAEQMAGEVLSSASIERVASNVGSALVSIPLEDLGARTGRVRGRGYVHETDAAWELLEEAIEPFRSDLERCASLGLTDVAAVIAAGIVSGLYQVRDPEMGIVLAYAGDDATSEIASSVLDLVAKLEISIPDQVAETYWPTWDDLR